MTTGLQILRGDPAPPRAPMPRHRASHQKENEKEESSASLFGMRQIDEHRRQSYIKCEKEQFTGGVCMAENEPHGKRPHFLGQSHSIVIHAVSHSRERSETHE